jgi:predicted Zn-dependent peptidase
MLIVAVGAVSADAFVPMVEKYCGAWEGPKVARRTGGVPARASGTQAVHQPNFSRQHLLFMSPAPARIRQWEEAAAVMTTVLGDEEHSRLYWELVEPGLVDAASLDDMAFEDCGAFGAYVSCEPAKAEEVARRTLEVLKTPSLPTSEELEMAKNKLMTATILEAEQGVGRYYALGTEILTGLPYRTLEEQAQAYDAVTVDHLAELLKAYPLKDWAVTTIGPLEQLD